MARKPTPPNLFRWFDSSPEVIRLRCLLIIDHVAGSVRIWRLVGSEIEIKAQFGVAKAPLGGLVPAPAIIAQEKLKEMVSQANRPVKRPTGDIARFNVLDE